MARERIVEGRWNCGSCGAQGVLGRHKTCPGCGNPREQGSETSFDFGAPTASGGSTAETVTEAAVLELAHAGEDWHCGYCESANRGDTAVCRSCGADRAEAEPRRPPPLPVAPRPLVAAAPSKPRRWPWALLGAMVVSCGVCTWGLRERDVDAQVAAKSWSRRVVVQTFTRVEKRGWKDDLRVQRAVMPLDGRGEVPGVEDVADCVRKQRGTRQVADGTERVCRTQTRSVACGTEERCHVEDQGNGFGREVCDDVTKYCRESYEDCRNETKYRTEPVYGQECRYRTWEWRDGATRTASGATDAPRWPEVEAGRLDRLVKTEEYRVEVRYDDDKVHVVKPSTAADFARWEPGAPVRLVVNNLGMVREASPR